jgi:uncharacterized membrane protein
MRSSIAICLAAAAVASCSNPAGNNGADANAASSNAADGNMANTVTVSPAAGNLAEPAPAEPSVNGTMAGDANAFEPIPIGPPPNRTANYRASGTEPFWSLTIANGEMRYERPGHIVAADTPELSPLRNGFDFRTPLLTARFTNRRCTEASGQSVRYTVRVTVEGRTVNGCGQ